MTDYVQNKTQQTLLYIDNLRKGGRQFPPSLHVALTDWCFNKCIMCTHWQRETKYSLLSEVLLNFLQWGKVRGLETVCYTGGDPLHYPELNTVMSWHLQEQVPFGIVTAGYIPAKIDLDMLAGAQFIRVSLDSVTNYQFCRGGISLNQVKFSLEDLLNKKANVSFFITVHKHNYAEVDCVLYYALKLLVKEVRLYMVRERPNLSLSLEECKKIASVVHVYKRSFEIAGISHNFDIVLQELFGQITIKPFAHCYAVLYQWYINADGTVSPCCLTAGDVTEKINYTFGIIDQPERLWQQALQFSLKTVKERPQICQRCIVRFCIINNTVKKFWDSKNFF